MPFKMRGMNSISAGILVAIGLLVGGSRGAVGQSCGTVLDCANKAAKAAEDAQAAATEAKVSIQALSEKLNNLARLAPPMKLCYVQWTGHFKILVPFGPDGTQEACAKLAEWMLDVQRAEMGGPAAGRNYALVCEMPSGGMIAGADLGAGVPSGNPCNW